MNRKSEAESKAIVVNAETERVKVEAESKDPRVCNAETELGVLLASFFFKGWSIF